MENSKWIWINDNSLDKNMYAEFYDTFTYNGKSAKIKISADSNYALYINDVFVNSGQYPDFPHYKVYDELDIISFCKTGENNIGIIVWYYGVANMSYYLGKAALKYSLYADEELSAKSDENTLSRLSIIADKDRYKDIILGEIDTVFEKMLKADATSFWETEGGPANCGSLCHGWSALPIYYYSILEK